MLHLPSQRSSRATTSSLQSVHGPERARPARLGLITTATAAGVAAVWLLANLLDGFVAKPWTGDSASAWAGAAVGLVSLVLCWLVARRPRLAPAAIVSATAVTVSGLALLALHGTRWNFNGVYSDLGFRTQAATRFADSPALADYGYRDLPSYYPPALPWIQGRLADLAGVPAWAMMKPVTIVLAALIPVLAYLLWRRVVPDLPAACVVAATSLATANLTKPDEWFVLALLVPWWLELVRGVRLPSHRPWSVWVHGSILGGLLLFHSYYFLALGVATMVAALVDLVCRRPMTLRPLRALAVGGIGLVVAVPYWLGMAVQKLKGAPGDDLQRRWSEVGFTMPPLPLPTDVVGAIGMLGVLWLAFRTRTDRLAEALTVALATTYAVFVGGQWLQRFELAILPEKSDPLISALLVVSGVLALHDVWRRSAARLPGRLPRPGRVLVATGVAVALSVLLSLVHAQLWVSGRPPLAAQQMRYPDGSYPAGGVADPETTRHPWSVTNSPLEPSVDEVEQQWRDLTGRALDSGTVLVSSRADILATRPVHPFVMWKSIYSHPYGQFEDRLALLQRVSACGGPRCAAELLRENPFDPVDGLILTRTRQGLRLSVTTDKFPDGWELTRLHFDERLFRGPWFERRDVGGVAVVALTAP